MNIPDCIGCPFCGSAHLRINGHMDTAFYVVCTTCSTYGPSAPSIEEAKKLWNKRWVE